MTGNSAYTLLTAIIGDLENLTTESKETLVAAINEAAEGGGGGGGEPSAYIKNAAVSSDGLTLTLTKKNGTTVTFSVDDLNTAIAALETEVDGKQDAISDLSTIRYGATDGRDAMIILGNDSNYITLEAEDSDTHEVTTFKIFGEEIEEGGGV